MSRTLLRFRKTTFETAVYIIAKILDLVDPMVKIFDFRKKNGKKVDVLVKNVEVFLISSSNRGRKTRLKQITQYAI